MHFLAIHRENGKTAANHLDKNSRNNLRMCKKLSQKVNETKILRFLK